MINYIFNLFEGDEPYREGLSMQFIYFLINFILSLNFDRLFLYYICNNKKQNIMKLNITKVLTNIANEEYSTRFLLNANTEWNISADTDYINMYRTEVEMLNQKNMMVQE